MDTNFKKFNKIIICPITIAIWRTHHHPLLVELLNTWRDHKGIFAWVGDKVVVLDVHTIEEVFKISSKGWRSQKQANKTTIETMLKSI
jgi:hypothetical protein